VRGKSDTARKMFNRIRGSMGSSSSSGSSSSASSGRSAMKVPRNSGGSKSSPVSFAYASASATGRRERADRVRQEFHRRSAVDLNRSQ
jgi:hypothetical protein